MKTGLKKGTCLLLVCLFLACLLPAGPAVSADEVLSTALYAPGSVAGYYLSTDIVTTVSGTRIEAINIGGRTLISAEDMAYHGFKVSWDGDNRTLSVSWRDSAVGGGPEVRDYQLPIGSVLGPYYYTDIQTYLDGQSIESYNTGGRTYICAEDMRGYGYTVAWDGNARTLSVTAKGASSGPQTETPSPTPAAPSPTPAAPSPTHEPSLYVPASSLSSDVEGLAVFLHDQIWQSAPAAIRFNMWEYNIRSDDELKATMSEVFEILYRSPDMFILQGKYNFSWRSGLVSFSPTYYRFDEGYENAKARYLEGVDGIVSQISSGWSDLEKLIFLNSYLSTHFEYDESLSIFDAYGLFRYGAGVCEAYTMVALAVLDRVGIPATYVSSDSMEHAWAAVQLYGNWYNLDFTWNDPVPDMRGTAFHDWFLLSDQAMKTKDDGSHYLENDWTSIRHVSCTDTTYDNYFWQEAISPMLYTDGQWFYVSGDGLMAWDGYSNGARSVLPYSQVFREWYPYTNFSLYSDRSGLFERDGMLYFNSSFNIIRTNPYEGVYDCYLDLAGRNNEYVISCWLNTDGTVGFLHSDGTQYFIDE